MKETYYIPTYSLLSKYKKKIYSSIIIVVLYLSKSQSKFLLDFNKSLKNYTGKGKLVNINIQKIGNNKGDWY